MLEKAILLAVKAHKGQRDKGGKPYILHCLRVMLSVENEKEQIVAVLHDILEDTMVTKETLQKEGFCNEIIEAVIALTKKEEENYFDYIERLKNNTTAKKVKLADLKDNMNIKRILHPTQQDSERVEKYKKAKKLLEEE